MKSIKKLKSAGKAVAGSALLVGATLTGAAGFAAAQNSGSMSMDDGSMDLGDYPAPFVQDGEVDTTIVVGQQAKTADVVGAINVAGSLGNAAFKKETKSVSVTGTGGSWSATGGVTLDTRNDALYFGDKLTEVRDTLTNEQLGSLEDTTFRDDDGDETDIENYLYPGDQRVTFGKPDDRNNEDPIVYVKNPSNPDSGNNLFKLEANFEDEIAFNATDVEDEEIQLFGQTWTVSTDTTDSELVLLGSQQTTTVDSGTSKTITVNGEEHTLSVTAVTGPNTAAIKVDGELREENEDDEFTVNGKTVRVDDIIQTSSEKSAGTVQFAIGSDEIVMKNGQQIEDENGDDIDGTKVVFNGDTSLSNAVDELSSISVYVGSDNDDHEYLRSGESYSHPLFPDFAVRMGGLSPDATMGMQNGSVGEVEYGVSSDDVGTVSLDSQGSSATVEFAYDSDVSNNANNRDLADGDGDEIYVQEGLALDEDQYMTTDAGDFSHLWEVTSIDRDATSSISSGDEATITLTDAVSGQSVEVDLDADNGADDAFDNTADDYYGGTEVIDGQTYTFVLEGEDSDAVEDGDEDGSSTDVPDFRMAYGGGTSDTDTEDNSDTTSSGALTLDTGDRKSVYAPIDTDSRAAVALTEDLAGVATGLAGGDSVTLELPSTESTDAKTVKIGIEDGGGSSDFNVTVNGNTELTTVSDTGTFDVQVGQVVYGFTADETGTTTNGAADSVNLDIGVASDQGSGDDNDGATLGDMAGVTMMPEDDNDEEHAYVTTFSDRSGSDGLTVDSPTYTGTTGTISAQTPRITSQLESDDDITAGVGFYGTHTEYDSDEEGSFTLHIPFGQSTAGVAVTGPEGSISASGGGSGSVQTMTPTGWPDAAALDSDVTGSERNQNLILVGGPRVNTLVQELANQNMTWTGDQYSQDQYVLDLTEGFDGDGGSKALVVAGHSADDTVAASNFLANYEDNSQALAGKTTLTRTTTAQ